MTMKCHCGPRIALCSS